MPQATSDTTTRSRRRPPPALWRLGEGAPPSGPFVALVPGTEAPLVSVTLPATLKGPAREDVARRQVLDRLGLPALALDIRAARLGGDEGWSRVLTADRATVLRWRSGLGSAAARCRAMVPDYLAVPVEPGCWAVDADAEGVRVRLGPADGFAAEPELGAAMLATAVAQARAANAVPRAVTLTGDAPGIAAALAGLPIRRAASSAAFAQGELALDLLRDPRADAAGIERRLRRIAAPLALVLAGALGWAGATALATRHDLRMAEAVEAQTLAAARRDILPSGPIVDLRVQVAREIAARRAAAGDAPQARGPLAVLRAAAPVFEGGEAVVQGLSVVPTTERVTLDLGLPDFRALDAAVEALGAAGIAARVTRSGTAPEGGVSAAILIGGAP